MGNGMTENRQEKLEQILIGLLPANGTTVGNGQLSQRWAEAALAANFAVVEAEFTTVRDDLLARGLVVKGKGRGGSTGLAAAAAPGADDFSLQTGDMTADDTDDQPTPSRKAKAPAAKPRAASDGDAQVLAYRHADRRKNNPEVGLVSEASDPQQPKKEWAYNPHLDPVLNFDSARAELETLVDDALASGDEATMREALAEIKRRGAPYLQWTGKAERTSFEVDTVSLHVHERVDPLSILAAVRKRIRDEKAADKDKANTQGLQASLFEAPFEAMPLRDAVDFYRHDKGWANRLVSGDSLQVMNSLLVKEGMAGQVQMIFIDPPYGIKYGSNFQPFVGKKDVKDKSDSDLTQEPEMIKAFRDTWELGIHSYLTYLRDRLLLARELLSETGSVFVQISDENLHHVRTVMEEVFGANNFVSVIAFRKKLMPLGAKTLEQMSDFLVWYAKDKPSVKYNHLYQPTTPDPSGRWTGVYTDQLFRRRLSKDERKSLREGAVPTGIFGTVSQWAPSYSPTNDFPFPFRGQVFHPTDGQCWVTSKEKMHRLSKAGRLFVEGEYPRYVNSHEDFPLSKLTAPWSDTAPAQDKTYVVQTSERVIERCIALTTSPGDLVFDPTCGSGTTAFVAEKLGRRWVTCDTSRVAVTLAKQRLMTAGYDYFELAYPHEGLKGGFIYKTMPRVTLKSIANSPDIDAIFDRLYPSIEAALIVLNKQLAAVCPGLPLLIAEGARKGQKIWFGEGGDSWLQEWEVPFPADDGTMPESLGWDGSLRAPFAAFHTARRTMQAEMDRAIAASADNETLYDQPERSKTKLRITGPFTVEAVPFPTVLSLEAAEGGAAATPTEDQSYQSNIARSGETSRQQQWRDELLKTGIRGKGGQMLRFAELEVMAGTTCLHATGTLADTGERAVVSFGPEYGALEQRQVEHAIGEASELFPRPKIIVFCSFAFDPEAAKDIDAMKGITALKAQMNTDLLTDDLKKARSSNQSFWLMGQPDVALRQNADGLWQVEVNGFDYFDTIKGELISGGKTRIAMWSLDTDYDGRSLFPHQVFFPMAGKDEGWMKLKKTIRAELDEGLLGQFHGTVSLPFEAGKNGKAAVKIVDDRGIESLKILILKATA